jgi:hypothetical protein
MFSAIGFAKAFARTTSKPRGGGGGEAPIIR